MRTQNRSFYAGSNPALAAKSMNLKELIKKLAEKPDQKQEVQFAIWTDDGNIVCADMSGAMTRDMMKVFAKHAPKEKAE